MAPYGWHSGADLGARCNVTGASVPHHVKTERFWLGGNTWLERSLPQYVLLGSYYGRQGAQALSGWTTLTPLVRCAI